MASKRDIDAESHIKHNVVEPDESHRQNAIEGEDVEGHSMMLNPTLGRDLAKAKSVDVERGVRAKNNENEAKRIFRR
jgi:hypothetical protein